MIDGGVKGAGYEEAVVEVRALEYGVDEEVEAVPDEEES